MTSGDCNLILAKMLVFIVVFFDDLSNAFFPCHATAPRSRESRGLLESIVAVVFLIWHSINPRSGSGLSHLHHGRGQNYYTS